jgi:hypothetical protein
MAASHTLFSTELQIQPEHVYDEEMVNKAEVWYISLNRKRQGCHRLRQPVAKTWPKYLRNKAILCSQIAGVNPYE